MSPAARKRLTWILGLAFALTMVMGPGPGVLLVNRAELFLGWPLVYVWGVFWYGVQLSVILLSYALLWRQSDTADSDSER